MTDRRKRVEDLSPAKRELLALRLRGKQGRSPRPSIPRGERPPHVPLSFAQQRLWFLEQLAPGNVAYNVATALQLRGPLNEKMLEQSLLEIVRRHEVLRTTFRIVGGQATQVVTDLCVPVLTIEDVGTGTESEIRTRILERAVSESRRPFDLARGPLLRTVLLRTQEQEFVLVATMHHIVADGWSLEVFIRELTTLYNAHLSHAPPRLPELSIQYGDYALWQRQWLRNTELEPLLSYWKQRLGGNLPVLNLPVDHPRPGTQSYRGGRFVLLLPRSLADALQMYSEHAGTTLFMTLLAAFNAFLHRYTGQDDIVLGSPIANRHTTQIENLIGFFANTIVLRSDLSGDPTFRELVARIRESALSDYGHQELPFEKLVEELHPPRDPSRHPLFQVMFSLQTDPLESMTLSGVTVSPIEFDNETAKFDLSLFVSHAADGLLGCFEYSTDLFEATTIERMAGQFRTLLEGAVANPDIRLSALPLLSHMERSEIVVQWNATASPYPEHACLPQLFEDQVARTPDAVAVQYGSESLTYACLNGTADRIARRLRGYLLEPEAIVGICMQRSVDMLVAILAVSKAGCAYLPLDPTHPHQRLALVLRDAGARLLLTDDQCVEGLAGLAIEMVCLDSLRLAPEGSDHDDLPHHEMYAANLAYVIYTSGSTGQPKGVQITHRSLVNFLTTMQRQLAFTEGDVLLAVTTLSFDIAALELLLPITCGGRTVLVSHEVAADGRELMDALANVSPTVMQATPATWHVLLATGWTGNPTLKILCGGEALPAELAGRLARAGSALWNLYGPTETTIWSTTCHLQSTGPRIAIGKPIANTQIYLLDDQRQPVPIGVPGHLYIGGAGLARGYLKRPALTAERFLPDPLAAQPGGRLYRTGDLARYLPNGDIEFLGRLDYQVKIRGFRVELEDVEAALRTHESIRDTVVTDHGDSLSDRRLIAYVVGDGSLSTLPLRRFLKDRLPAYMVPSRFVFLDALPRGTSGKVDRQRLPLPDASLTTPESLFAEPCTVLQQSIAAIWRETLKLERVGLHDNFFDLGGTSLDTITVIERLDGTLNIKAHPADFFAQTLEQFAAICQEQLRGDQAATNDAST